MCIICNCGIDNGDAFLMSHVSASSWMKKATKAMLTCSKTAKGAAERKQYDATHKKMVKILKDWNRIEEFREASPYVPKQPEDLK